MRKLLIALTVLAVLLAGTPAMAKPRTSIQGPIDGGGMLSPGTGATLKGPIDGGGMLSFDVTIDGPISGGGMI